jgi:hypothetical protein
MACTRDAMGALSRGLERRAPVYCGSALIAGLASHSVVFMSPKIGRNIARAIVRECPTCRVSRTARSRPINVVSVLTIYPQGLRGPRSPESALARGDRSAAKRTGTCEASLDESSDSEGPRCCDLREPRLGRAAATGHRDVPAREPDELERPPWPGPHRRNAESRGTSCFFLIKGLSLAVARFVLTCFAGPRPLRGRPVASRQGPNSRPLYGHGRPARADFAASARLVPRTADRCTAARSPTFVSGSIVGPQIVRVRGFA